MYCKLSFTVTNALRICNPQQRSMLFLLVGDYKSSGFKHLLPPKLPFFLETTKRITRNLQAISKLLAKSTDFWEELALLYKPIHHNLPDRSQRHLFYYHTSTPIGSLPVRSRQLLRTKFSSFSTILRLFSLEAFQRRRASSLVNFVVSIVSIQPL